MIKPSQVQDAGVRYFILAVFCLLTLLSPQLRAAQITLSVEDQTAQPVTGFRYLVEEDLTFKPTPGVPDFGSLSFDFHKSHAPVAQDASGQGIQGATTGSSVVITVPDNKNYFVSVMPFDGYAMGGGPVSVTTGTVDKTIRVNKFPIPTAQISIRVFEDNNPVNGAIDQGERFLSHSIINGQKVPFTITLFDAAGQYGAAGGRVTQDAYGNPLGTEYDAAGNIISMPDTTNGFQLTPDANGYLVVKHLPPGKYGVEVVPPPGPNGEPLWFQTSTIEGTRTIDAWVKANEPEVFVEFGPPGPHVFVGFVRTFDCLSGDSGVVDQYYDAQGVLQSSDSCAGITPTVGGATITGRIVDNHMSRPGPLPVNGQGGGFQFASGVPFPGCRIAVNMGLTLKTVYSGKCNDDSTFTIDNLAPGSYSLSIWDDGLDMVIANHAFTVTGNAQTGYQVSTLVQQQVSNVNGTQPTAIPCDVNGCDLGDIPVFNWFHKLDTMVFFDRNENGYRDCVTAACNDPAVDDVPLHPLAATVNIRWRDGRIYQSVPLSTDGAAEFGQVFPFFHWLVAEVDYTNFKSTGVTVISYGGGYDPNLSVNGYVPQPDPNLPTCIPDPSGIGVTNSPCTFDGGNSRTETGPVLTMAFQGFLGQKNILQFGKTSYGPGENGGVTGVVVYAITRAEDDPRYAVANMWEPGIPRVQVALYQDFTDVNGQPVVGGDQVIDDLNGNGQVDLADVDNYPLGWSTDTTGTVLPGPEDIDRNGNGRFDKGDAVEVTWTDSWDDSKPTGCLGANNLPGLADDKCFDGLRNWNQVRPGVFDGGYAFSTNLPAGTYIVQSYTPPGYELVKEEDKNVDFGDEYAVPQALPPVCVGAPHTVPPYLSRATVNGQLVMAGDPADFAAPFAGETRPLCDTKQVVVADGKNAAADFHYFTQVPKAAHVVGGVINDLANEFNPNAPTFGEKFSPPWVPVAFYDYNGHEITRVYTDQYGKYNALLPSTSTINVASPSGVSPNMITACMNDAGLVDNPAYTPGSTLPKKIVDPNYNPQYSQFCYTFQYMPGGTTYLDTPVVSVAAFAGSGKQLDCDAADQTPLISSVSSAASLAGAYIPDATVPDDASRMLTINSAGVRDVYNPSSDELTHKFIQRDYGFGTAQGAVQMVGSDGFVHNLLISSWSDQVIQAPVPQGIAPGRYQLQVVHANGNVSPMGVTVTVGPLPRNGVVHEVFPSPLAGATPIQDALDAASRGDLILVAPGTYNELPIMYKPVILQGAGAYSTIINARSVPAEKVQQWRNKIMALFAQGAFDLLPGQGAEALPGQAPRLFDTEEGPGLTVVAKSVGPNRFSKRYPSGVDGFTITGASTGGGVFLSAYVNTFTISNNLITGNQGTYGGGIRLGHTALREQTKKGLRHPDAKNRNVTIHHNMITRNGTFFGAGGGISLYTGARNYTIEKNLICGNFAKTDGGGIGHLGLSTSGKIRDNQIIFNQSFRQMPGETDGGGILIAGASNLNGGGISAGAGHVRIERNLIQGNHAGAGDGGGIALRRVNGQDIVKKADKPNKWWVVRVLNNTIVNNVAGVAGGAISLKDAARTIIWNNTIVNNESTATAGAAFQPGNPSRSTVQVAGIVSRQHETIAGLIQPATPANQARYGVPYSNPFLRHNILLHNRSRIYDLASNAVIDPVVGSPSYIDLGVVPALPGYKLRPNYSMLTDATGYNATNITGTTPAQEFVRSYTNGSPFLTPSPLEFQTIKVAPALDEGGNWIEVRYAPLSINDVDGLDNGIEVPSDYHLKPTSGAVNAGNGTRGGGANLDIDRQPIVGVVDMGSDEVQ